jgi:hypothetical protein
MSKKRKKVPYPKGAKLVSNCKKGAKQHPMTQVPEMSQERWESIFGTSGKPQCGTYVYDPAVDAVVKKEDVKQPNEAPAVHDDRMYQGVFDFGAGRVFNSRSERAQWMKDNGVTCVG